MSNTKKRDSITQKVALLTGYHYDTVRRVRNGEYSNELIERVLMEIVEGENKLLEAVKLAVPFDEVDKRSERKKVNRA